MVRLLIVFVSSCLALFLFVWFFCFEGPHVAFRNVCPAQSTCRFFWAALSFILLSVLSVFSLQCVGKLQAKLQLVIFLCITGQWRWMLALISYIYFYCESGERHISGADCRGKVKLSIYTGQLFLWAYTLASSVLMYIVVLM